MPAPTDPHPNFVNDVDVADGDQVDARFLALYRTLNPAAVGVDEANVNAATLKRLGLNDAAQGQVGRGAVVHAAAEAAPSTLGASMPTPDRISGLVVPANGVVMMRYSARFTAVTIHATNFFASVEVWLGGQQVTSEFFNNYFGQTLTLSAGSIGTFAGTVATLPLVSIAATPAPLGIPGGVLSSSALTGSPNIGTVAGVWQPLDVSAAGTYDLEVKWRLLTGGGSSVLVQDRRLQAYVWGP